ncbi:MAG: MerR family transcriptional regulator [Alphaproteobacteria bacterium]|nr:MerR family transcriptional regulator [Alphaproteobacteria bacterium]
MAEGPRSIGDVASELDVPSHVLRFWETRFPELRPLKKGSNRRVYMPEDVALLRGIRRLLYAEGLTVKGVQRVLAEQGVAFVRTVGHSDEPLSEEQRFTVRGMADGQAGEGTRILPADAGAIASLGSEARERLLAARIELEALKARLDEARSVAARHFGGAGAG